VCRVGKAAAHVAARFAVPLVGLYALVASTGILPLGVAYRRPRRDRKTRTGVTTFGGGHADDEEIRFLHAVIRGALKGA
jgi:hypothetical protein